MALEKAPGTGLCAPRVIKFMCDDCSVLIFMNSIRISLLTKRAPAMRQPDATQCPVRTKDFLGSLAPVAIIPLF